MGSTALRIGIVKVVMNLANAIECMRIKGSSIKCESIY